MTIQFVPVDRDAAFLLPWCEQAATMQPKHAELHLRSGLATLAVMSARLPDWQETELLGMIERGYAKTALEMLRRLGRGSPASI